MIRKLLPATSTVTVFLLAAALGVANRPATIAAAGPADAGRFVWRDLMTKDVAASKRFYGDLFGWRFEDTKRGGRPYVLARSGATLVAGIVDVSAVAEAGPQWISYLAVADVDKSVAQVRADGGKIFIEPRDLPAARVAVVADPQGAPLGLAQLKRDVPDPATPAQNQFFWQEYLARDAAQALTFYKSLAGYDESITDARLGIEYHILSKTRARAGLFQLPATSVGVEPNWLPYVLINDPSALAGRVAGLGGRVILPAAPERRNGSLVVIGDPGGAPLALQKYPF